MDYRDGAAQAALFTFEHAGNVTALGREDDTAVYYMYDAANKLLSEKWWDTFVNSQVYAFSYDWDAGGNRMKMRRESTINTEVQSASGDLLRSLPTPSKKLRHVTLLLSPPFFPSYNGAIEAGIGSLKTRAHLEAARHGHSCEWNCDDLELRASRPASSPSLGASSRSRRTSSWIERQAIEPELRRQLEHSVQEIFTNFVKNS